MYMTGRRVIALLGSLLLVVSIWQWYAFDTSSLYRSVHPGIALEAQQQASDPWTVESTWRSWSQAIRDCAPPASIKVTLSRTAPNRAPHPADKNPRGPYDELVMNGHEDIDAIRKAHNCFVGKLASIHPDRGREQAAFHGYGITVMGGGEYTGPAILSIRMLRRTGCDLPVEVFVFDKSEYESFVCESFLPTLNARCIILSDLLASSPIRFEGITHYQLKPLALLFSSFRHVLLLDSDSTPLINPFDELMQKEPYLSTGLVIWPDFWQATESPSFYKIAGYKMPTNLTKQSTESGQLLIDKVTHFATILLVIYYNVYGPDLYYPLLSQGALGQGDKETYPAAAMTLGQRYYKVRTPVVAANSTRDRGTGMIQISPFDEYMLQKPAQAAVDQVAEAKSPRQRPRIAFLHQNTPKFNAGHLVDEGDLIFSATEERIRLLGSEEHQLEVFGENIEKIIWQYLVTDGCALADKLKDWKGRRRLCARLNEHFDSIFPG